MSKKSKNSIALIVVVVCVAAALGFKVYSDSKADTVKGLESKAKGNPSASIKITEHIDFECPACAQGAKYLKTFMEENPGKVYLEMKYFPLKMHKHAFLASQYAECATRQQKFWPVHDLLIERQKQWKRLEDAEPAFKIIAEDAGMDLASLEVCLEDESIITAINKDREEGDVLKIQSTPTYFVNGERVVGFHNLLKEMTELIGDEKN